MVTWQTGSMGTRSDTHMLDDRLGALQSPVCGSFFRFAGGSLMATPFQTGFNPAWNVEAMRRG